MEDRVHHVSEDELRARRAEIVKGLASRGLTVEAMHRRLWLHYPMSLEDRELVRDLDEIDWLLGEEKK